MRTKLKEVLSEIKYPVFEGMKPEVPFKVQFSDDAFDYIVNEMISKGIVIDDGPNVIVTNEAKVEKLINKAFNAGMAYGITELLKQQGHFENIETKKIVKELLKDAL